jgi:starvation-inducible DNA-binding protein
MFTTLINIPPEDRAQLTELLNQQLADLSDLSSQTKQAHWNVRGRHFYQHHKLFEELADGVEEHIDELAERITTLGGYARGTVRDAARASRLQDFPAEQGDDQGYVDVLSGRFAECANEVRLAVVAAENLSDSTTADLLTAISRGLDKSLWMLEAHMRPLKGDVDADSTTGRDGESERQASIPNPSKTTRPRETATHRNGNAKPAKSGKSKS